MDVLKLNDGTEITLEPGGNLTSLYTVVNDFDALEQLAVQLGNPDNFKSVQIQSDGVISAEYKNLAYDTTFKSVDVTSDRIIAEFALRPMTNEELQRSDVRTAITYLTDEQALSVINLIPEWEDDPDGYEYRLDVSTDLRRKYSGRLWKLKKNHSKQADYYPGSEGTLWEEIIENHSGTIDDPIPVPESVTASGFTYIYGKYYLDENKVYLATREGKSNGEKETLYFTPSDLIGQYFKLMDSIHENTTE